MLATGLELASYGSSSSGFTRATARDWVYASVSSRRGLRELLLAQEGHHGATTGGGGVVVVLYKGWAQPTTPPPLKKESSGEQGSPVF